jgi:hypothetical protein
MKRMKKYREGGSVAANPMGRDRFMNRFIGGEEATRVNPRNSNLAGPAPRVEDVPSPPALSEAEEVQQSRRRQRQRAANRPMTRMSARRQMRPSEMSADDLNAMSLARGVGPDDAPDTEAAANIRRRLAEMAQGMKKGGAVKKMAKGGAVKKMAAGGVAASKRADGCAMRGKTKGRMV